VTRSRLFAALVADIVGGGVGATAFQPCNKDSVNAPSNQSSAISNDTALFKLITQTELFSAYALFPNADVITSGPLNGSTAHQPLVRVSMNPRALGELRGGMLLAGPKFLDDSVILQEIGNSSGVTAEMTAIYKDSANPPTTGTAPIRLRATVGSGRPSAPAEVSPTRLPVVAMSARAVARGNVGRRTTRSEPSRGRIAEGSDVLRASIRLLIIVVLSLTSAAAVFAQDDDDAVLKLAEPDFTLVSLPTALRLPRFGSAFRVTHRFTRSIGQGDFGDLVGDAFGLDTGARIGLEYRFGIVAHGEIGVHRTSDKTVEFFGQYGIVRQDRGLPVDLTALLSIDGTDNFKDQYSPAVGAIVSRTFREVAAIYVEPIFVRRSNIFERNSVADENTFMIGLGARVRLRPTVYVIGEFAPRGSGYTPNVDHASFAVEKRAGGHSFQLNVSNSVATTIGQIARGGRPSEWHLGFNISRKFY
jgi:hypothetical protein